MTPNLNIQPDIKMSLKQSFGIDSDMEVDAFSKRSEYVPEIDKNYKFDRDTTLAIISGFAFNKRVLVQGYHGTGKSTHIEQIAARLNWPCIRVNLDSHVSRIDLIGKDAIVVKDGKQITEFNTWNGLLVLSGVKLDAAASEHVYKSDDGNVALWFGGIDDLWSLGKPVGEGGPWKHTQVIANQLSDMYLMTGYDDKTVVLESDVDTQFQLYIHINHYLEKPVLFKTFNLKAGEKITYKFPEGFSAHWAQLKSSKSCKASARFIYK